MDKLVTLGRVAGVHGVRGWVKVYSYTQPMGNLFDYPEWVLSKGPYSRVRLIEGRTQGKGLVAELADEAGNPIADRDLAAALVDADIQVSRSAMPALPEGEHYWVDLEGLKVENLEGVALGQVHHLLSNGPQSILVVRQAPDVERLIPYVKGPIVKSVDVAAGVIIADWQPDY